MLLFFPTHVASCDSKYNETVKRLTELYLNRCDPTGEIIYEESLLSRTLNVL